MKFQIKENDFLLPWDKTLQSSQKRQFIIENISNSLKSLIERLDLSRVTDKNLDTLNDAIKLFYKTCSICSAFKLPDKLVEMTKNKLSEEEENWINRRDEIYSKLNDDTDYYNIYNLVEIIKEKYNLELNKNFSIKLYKIIKVLAQQKIDYINNLDKKYASFNLPIIHKNDVEKIYLDYQNQINEIIDNLNKLKSLKPENLSEKQILIYLNDNLRSLGFMHIEFE